MRNRPLALIGASTADIEAAFDEVQATDIEPLEEFKSEAALVRDEAAGKLYDLLTQARANEEAAEREAAARREREEAEREAEAEREEERQELARLRQFKADQEARETTEEAAEETPANKAFSDAVTHGTGVMSGGNHVPCETYFGVDMASGPDETVTAEVGGDKTVAETSRHESMASDDYAAARDGLIMATYGEISEDQACAILDDIVAGRVKNVAYIGTPSLED